jgi:hypothetical protein
MSDDRYQPFRNADGYPGADLSAERVEQIRRLEVPVDEISLDDIVHSVSRNGSGTFFLLMMLVAQTAGQAAADEIAEQFGYVVGRTNYRKMQRRFGVTTLGPERLSMYEDTVHRLSGSDMAYCFSEYDDDTCVVRRTRCAFHTGAPDGTGHLCPLVNRGFARAYQECDPLLEADYTQSLAWGDDECRHVFRYRREDDV